MGIKDSLPTSVMRAAGSVRGAYWRAFKPLTFGAAVAVTDERHDKIVLVRQTYGKKDQWQLPGGGIDNAEWEIARSRVESGQYPSTLPAALFEPSARREAREEIGISAEGPLRHLFHYASDETGNRDTLGIFHLVLPDIEAVELLPQRSEIAEIGIWEIDRMPVVGASYLGELAHILRESR